MGKITLSPEGNHSRLVYNAFSIIVIQQKAASSPLLSLQDITMDKGYGTMGRMSFWNGEGLIWNQAYVVGMIQWMTVISN